MAAVSGRLRAFVTRVYDPIVTYELNERRLALPLSHDLPIHRKAFPLYSENLARLARFIRSRRGGLCMIDVGANVGDSYHLSGPQPGDRFLLVEPDAAYFALLARNTPHDGSVTPVRTLLSDGAADAAGALVREHGTARAVAAAASGESVPVSTLDALVDRHPEFRRADLLKIDVDGFDSRVLAGATRLLGERGPVVLFEHHPQLLALAGDDDMYVFDVLARAGYDRAIVYDNFGLLVGAFATTDAGTLRDLVSYAKRRDGYYYDVCCFARGDAELERDYLAGERRLTATRAGVPGAAVAP